MSHATRFAGDSRRGDGDGPVRGRDGNAYLPVHPLYSAPARRRRGVLAARSAVSVLAFLTLLFATIGQVVPFAQEGKPRKTKITYSVWQEKEYHRRSGKLDEVEENDKTGAAKAFAILTVIFSLVAVILAAVYASVWSSDERTRFDEEDANDKQLARYGTERTGSDDSALSFPYSNTRVPNDQVDYIVFEEAEQRRRLLDRNMGIATFSMLLAAAVCALVTLILMSTFYTKRIDIKDYPKYREGLALFIITLVIGVVAFIVLAIPSATALYMCNGPPLRRAELMVLDGDVQVPPSSSGRTSGRWGIQPALATNKKEKGQDSRQQQRQRPSSRHASPPPPPPPGPPAAQMQPAPNPYYPPNDNVVAGQSPMAVTQGIPMALPGPPLESLPPHTLQQQQQQQQEYTSGAYYPPPPQLFNVGVGKGGKGKSV